MSRKSFNHEGYLSPFQKQKVTDIEELATLNFNPLHVTVSSYLGSHGFIKDDIRNYFISHQRGYQQTITG